MFQQLRIAAILLFGLTFLTGVVYPLVVTGIAQVVFPHQANGSLLRDGEQAVGSELIGQSFTKPEYFWGRGSATSPVPYNAASSSGSNFGPLHPALKESVEARIKALVAGGAKPEQIPVELVTASGSGLDPHISPAAAEFQISRVSASRRLPEEQVRKLVQRHTAHRQFGLLGEHRVNVLLLNRELDQQRSTSTR